MFLYRVVRPRLTIYVCQESQQTREQHQKHENGDGSNNTFFGEFDNKYIKIKRYYNRAQSICRNEMLGCDIIRSSFFP